MKHQQIDDKDRVWTVTRGVNGRLHQELDAGLLARIHPELSPREIAEALVIAAGEAEIDENRAW
jgi:hypothetical protein